MKQYIPQSHKTSLINVYFPRFSVETYETWVKYALGISTWIYGLEIVLGSYLIDRNDVIGAGAVRKFGNEEYYEFLNVPIIDPWELVYGDSWKDFRDYVKSITIGESDATEEPYELNNTGSLLNITLHPVRMTSPGVYTEIDNYQGGQNAINISDAEDDYLSFYIKDNINEDIIIPAEGLSGVDRVEDRLLISTGLKYNGAYDLDVDGFDEYMRETYQLSNDPAYPDLTGYTTAMEIVVQDNENIYRYLKLPFDLTTTPAPTTPEPTTPEPWHNTDIWSPWQDFDIRELQDGKGFKTLLFDSWEGYTEGMFLNIFLSIIPNDVDNDTFIYLRSNRIILTPEVFRYFVWKEDVRELNVPNKIFPKMIVYNVNAVNKIDNTVIQMERPDDYKANIIKPVFFRSRDLGNLIVHPEVTEQICINLDAYKSKVNSFILQLEGISFPEQGRTAAGVIFKIIGNRLPKSKTSGLYYILSQDSELVTTGKYTYES